MPDREKVINGLREMSCRCTWKDIDRIRDKFQPIVNGAIELLKEQEETIGSLQRTIVKLCDAIKERG